MDTDPLRSRKRSTLCKELFSLREKFYICFQKHVKEKAGNFRIVLHSFWKKQNVDHVFHKKKLFLTQYFLHLRIFMSLGEKIYRYSHELSEY